MNTKLENLNSIIWEIKSERMLDLRVSFQLRIEIPVVEETPVVEEAPKADEAPANEAAE